MPKSVRLRASNACEYCRQRKTRCDEGKPSCTLCSQRGLNCIYKSVSPSKLETTIADLYNKLEMIDAKLEGALQSGRSQINERDQTYQKDHLFNGTKAEEINDTYGDDILDSLFFDNNAFGKSMNKAPYMLPNFDLDAFLQQETVFKASSEEDLIINEGRFSLKGRLEAQARKPSTVLSKEVVDRYLESYLTHIYPVYPIACELQIHELKQKISMVGLQANAQSCMTLTLLALGSVTESGEEINAKHTAYWNNKNYQDESSESKVAPPAGWDYIWLALSMRERIMVTEKKNVALIAISLLISIYYLKIGELNWHYDELSKCSKLIYREYLMQERAGNIEDESQEPLIRFYWVCIHLERQFAKLYKVPKSFLYDLQDTIQMPPGCKSSLPRDSNGFYNFCFMTNILISNISDKTLKALQKTNAEFFSTQRVLSLIFKFESDLSTWRSTLGAELQWEDTILADPKEGLELRFLRLNYYLCFCSVYYILIEHLERNCTKVTDQIIDLLQKCIGSALSAIQMFAESDICDLTPVICYEVMSSMKIMAKAQTLLNSAWNHPLNFPFLLERSASKIEGFSLHSFVIASELENLKDNIFSSYFEKKITKIT